jgi:hypothetical protein
MFALSWCISSRPGNQLLEVPVSSRNHPARVLALSPVHPELSRRRRLVGGTGHHGLLRAQTACGCFWLVAFARSSKPRRRMVPWIVSLSLLICKVIQGAHVGLIEVLFVLGIKIVADKGEIEARSRALRDHIHAIQITDAIIVDHGRHGLLGDRKGQSIDIAPFGCQAGIPDEVSDDGFSLISGHRCKASADRMNDRKADPWP